MTAHPVISIIIIAYNCRRCGRRVLVKTMPTNRERIEYAGQLAFQWVAYRTRPVRHLWHRRRLIKDFPFFACYEAQKRDCLNELCEEYDHYVTTVSSEGMSISLDMACLLHFLCWQCRPEVIFDFGSGFSSFVFRRYQRQAEPGCEVYSVDTDSRWLELTRQHLLAHGLSTDHLCLLPDFMSMQGEVAADLVLIDLGGTDNRLKALEALVKPTGRRTLVVLDDMQRPELRQAIDRLRPGMFSCYPLETYTRDRIGRYAWMLSLLGTLIDARSSRQGLAAR